MSTPTCLKGFTLINFPPSSRNWPLHFVFQFQARLEAMNLLGQLERFGGEGQGTRCCPDTLDMMSFAFPKAPTCFQGMQAAAAALDDKDEQVPCVKLLSLFGSSFIPDLPLGGVRCCFNGGR